MEKIGGCGGDEDLPPPRYVIEILLWLPVVSLLRFKSVCKSWRALIESSFFIDLHTATTFNPSSSSSSKFGSFILHAAVRSFFPISASEHALFMVSSVSDDDSEESGSARCWWSTTSCWMSIVVTKTCSLRSDDLVLKIKMVDDGLGYVWKIQSDDGFYEDRVFKVVEDDDLLLKIKMVNGCVGYVWKIKSDDDCYDDRVFKVVEDGLGGGGGESIDQLVLKLDKLGFPSCYKFNNRCNNAEAKEKVIAGSCNGLVCLHDLENSRFNRGTQEFYLCNPATGHGRILPKPITIDRDPGNHNLVAFGFDVQTQDYKVVLLTVLCPRWNGDGPSSECFCRVQVYSLSTDSWKILEGIPCLPGYPFIKSKAKDCCKGGLYLNGSCFFLAHFIYSKKQPCLPVNDRFIISFDFTKEIITPIQLPDHHPNQRLYLCYMGDNKIALFTVLSVYQDGKPISYHEKPISEDFNVWVLIEHGTSSSSLNKGSWTKLHSFRIEIKRASISYIPRGISNDGKFALLETGYSFGLGKKMILYNLVTKEMKRNFLSCGEVMSKAHPYKPSLVSVIGGYGAQQQQHADRVI